MESSTCKPLPDYLHPGLKLLFVGFNPSIRSGELGHHFASPNNRFWKILNAAGLTPRQYLPVEDASLLNLGYGLTNIAARPTRAAADVTTAEYSAGRELLRHKIELYTPRVVCFVGKGVYQIYSRQKQVDWGLQTSQEVPGVIDFVAPSSSGLVRLSMEEIVAIYRQLSEYLGNSQP